MRFVHPVIPRPPAYGTIRQRSVFLWWPVRVGLETRWLERATLVEVWTDGWGDKDFWKLQSFKGANETIL